MRFGPAPFAAATLWFVGSVLLAQTGPDGSTPLHDAVLKGDLARAIADYDEAIKHDPDYNNGFYDKPPTHWIWTAPSAGPA